MKKFIALICAVILSMAVIGTVGCSFGEKDKKTIVCTIYPQYDWVNVILGDTADRFEVKYLTEKGIDMHNYSPSAGDIITISTCDLFIYVGGESDGWVTDVLKQAKNEDMLTLCMLEYVDGLEEEIKEGMQDAEDGDHDHGHDDGEEAIEYDEHVWLSLRNASALVEALTESICALDGDNADEYRANSSEYTAKLSDLDNEYKAVIGAAKYDTLIVADRFPFIYLTNDYGLDYYAAFSGCSAEAEISISTLTFLIEKANELGVSHVIVTESADERVANTISSETQAKNLEILVLDSCQSVNKSKIEQGYSYYQAMADNLVVLSTALN